MIRRLRKIWKSHRAYRVGTILIAVGFIVQIGISMVGYRGKHSVWIQLPIRDYRVRLMADLPDLLTVRTYFGTWSDYRIELGLLWAAPLYVGLMIIGFQVRHNAEVRRTERRRRWLMTIDRCVQCQYHLMGNTSGVCPECGTSVSRN